jgi:FtsZ-binding cell division protein ZapB
MKHLQHEFEIFETLETRLKHVYGAIATICNIQIKIKHLKYTFETPKTLKI